MWVVKLLGLIVFIVVFAIVSRKANVYCINKWGKVGDVWYDRTIQIIFITLLLATDGWKPLLYLYMLLLGYSLIKYNPWAMAKIPPHKRD